MIQYIDGFEGFSIIHIPSKSAAMAMADGLLPLSKTRWDKIKAEVLQFEERLVSPLCELQRVNIQILAQGCA